MSEEESRILGWVKGRQGSRKPKEMFIYVITEADTERPCKIGYASDPDKRRFTLSCGNYRELIVRHRVCIPWPKDEEWLAYVDRVHEAEISIHKQFSRDRLRGEWFDVHCGLIQQAMNNVPR